MKDKFFVINVVPIFMALKIPVHPSTSVTEVIGSSSKVAPGCYL